MAKQELRTEIWSSGGGTQSSAIAALICQGELPKPDLAIIVDTEREMSTTWDFLNEKVLPALKNVGVELHRVPKSKYATVDLKRNDDWLIPAYTTETGEVGKLPTFCSNEWKQRVVRRWAVEQGVKKANIWIGFTIDELVRVKVPLGKWQHRYPLLDRRMTKGDCIALVERMGWGKPPGSSCYMCPNKNKNGWLWQKINAPGDHQKAIEFEKKMQEDDPELWLTESAIPLSELELNPDDDMFTGTCDNGYCFT